MQTISVVEARSRFSELLSRAAAGERFLIQRRERTVAVLLSHQELSRLEQAAQMAHHLARSLGQDEVLLEQVENQSLHPAMAAFGLWRDEAQFDNLAAEIIRERQANSERYEVNFEDSG
jgi:antitoxin (DNA-binding transcriptional repressor) of toxin-antitoxin stability system